MMALDLPPPLSPPPLPSPGVSGTPECTSAACDCTRPSCLVPPRIVQTGCVPINSSDRLFVKYVPETQKGSLSFVPLGTRGEVDVKSVLADNDTKEDGDIAEPFDVEANDFADMILLDEDEDDNDDDENNQLVDAAIDEQNF